MWTLLKHLAALAFLALLFTFTAGQALASSPARSETIAVGPYIVDVQLTQDPPYADQPLQVIVVPHDHSLHLQGRVTVQPGPGTDAVPLHFPLQPTGEQTGALSGTIHIPVQGAWQIVVDLNGPQGSGSGSINVTVGALGAMPSWLAWLIGCLPLLGVGWWVYNQHRYRQQLATAHKLSPET